MREQYCELMTLGGSEPHRLHYVEWGDESSSKVVMCLHGLTRNARDFDFIAKTLVDKGDRVICPNMAGRGKSAYLSNPKLYGYPLYVADVIMLLDQLGLKQVDMVGTSMGGLIGMMISQLHPTRLSRLVINDIGPFIPADALNRIAQQVSEVNVLCSQKEVEAYYDQYLVSFGVHEREHRGHIIKHGVEKHEDGCYHFCFDSNIASPFLTKSGKVKTLPDLDIWSVWEGSNVPVLLLRGKDSDVLPIEVAKRMEEKSGVELVEFDDVGHAPMLMEKKQIDVVVDWLEEM